MRNSLMMTTSTTETITSIEVANMIGKEHSQLLKDMRRYINQLGKVNFDFSNFFQESTYISEQNKELPCFNVTRKGCEFIANKLTGQKGTEFTARYVNRFHELEEGNITTSFVNALNSIVENLNTMRIETNNRLTKLEETQSQLALPTLEYKKPYNPWFAKM